MVFVFFKLLLATAIVLLCYAVYRQLKSGPRRGASNQRSSIDPSRVAEAEYSILDEEEVERENRG
ncbi:MAG: hypothetical protein F4Z57_12810 [Gemmatimonadetes bacterium]|nr:hypothetical protein [Gemmatimonadota bacterium]